MSVERVQVWIEFASTYSYPAVERVEAVAAQAGVPIEWKPFLLGPIFQQWGWKDSPFNLYPVKGAYMWRDMERLCARYGLPFQKPSRFPRSGLTAARITLAMALDGDPGCGDFVRAVYRANFAEDRDIASWDVLVDVLRKLGRDPIPIVERASSGAIREALKAQNRQAESLGLFGAPSFVVDGELFWGQDRLEDAVHWAAHGPPPSLRR